MRRILLLAVFALIATFFATSPSRGEDIVVGVEQQAYLPHFGWSNGRYAGFAADVLDAWAAAEGYRIRYQAFPIRRLTRLLVAGDIDLKFPDNPDWSPTLKKDVTVVYSDLVVSSRIGTHVRPWRLGTAADSIGTLGMLGGFWAEPWRPRIAAGTTVISYSNTPEGLVRQALADRVDAVYLNADVLAYILRETLARPGALVLDPGLPQEDNRFHVSTVTRHDLIASLNGWLRANRGHVEALRRRHGVGLH